PRGPRKDALMTDLSSPAPADPEPARPGILVVDDDAMLLMLLRTVLSRKGFRVWTANEGHAAVTLFHQHCRPQVSLVLLDVCMPGLDGPHTLAELRRVEPTLRACFMSGHPGTYGPDDL